ncbi:MAG: MerR family transcriptional regulator [Thermodesulfobacteriota bacterium]|nr:MerR family transcriptional regulator [Thermodesulfobacteriota bacterium]
MGIKIGEVSKKSGVPPSTIRYYVRQGLLPEPDKVNKSMAYYDEGCIEKIRVIRYLKEMRYYPLSVIKNILRRMDKGLGLEEAESIEDAVFGVNEELVDKKAFMHATGLTSGQIRDAEAMGLLMPYMHENVSVRYDQEDIRFGKDALKKILDMGGDLSRLEFYVTQGNKIVDEEIILRKKIVKGKSTKENMQITTEISKMADFMRTYIIRRIFQRKIQKTISRSLENG